MSCLQSRYVACIVISLLSYSAVVCQMLQVRASLICIILAFYISIYMLCIYAVKITPGPYFTVTLTSSADRVCPGDTVVFTCVTDTGRVIWIVNNNVDLVSLHSINQIKMIVTKQIFKLLLVNVTGIDNKIYLSTAMCYLIIMEQSLLVWMVMSRPTLHDFVCANR